MKRIVLNTLSILWLMGCGSALTAARPTLTTIVPIPWDNEQTEASAQTILDQTLHATPGNSVKNAVGIAVANHQRLAPEIVIAAIHRTPADACPIAVSAMDALGKAPSADDLAWIAQAVLNNQPSHSECGCHVIVAAIEHLPKNADQSGVTKIVHLADTYHVRSECVGNVLAAASSAFPQYAAEITDAVSENIGSTSDNDGKDYKGIVNDGKESKTIETIGSEPDDYAYVPPPGPTLPPVFIGGFPPPVTPVANR